MRSQKKKKKTLADSAKLNVKRAQYTKLNEFKVYRIKPIYQGFTHWIFR